MAAQLEIFDGNPWYLSPDVWVVPGGDPTGAPGLPVAGQPAYLWARVHNTGDQNVSDFRVNFYWANPAVGFDRTTANEVGSANVTVSVGAAAEVLCLVPWVPAYLNEGHECVLAEVLDPNASPPSPAFDVPTDPRVAQFNLSVLRLSPKMLAQLRFEVHNTGRLARTYNLSVKRGDVSALRKVILQAALDKRVLKLRGEVKKAGLVASHCATHAELDDAPSEIRDLRLEPGERAGFNLVAELTGGGALLHVIQSADGVDIGGLSALLLAQKD